MDLETVSYMQTRKAAALLSLWVASTVLMPKPASANAEPPVTYDTRAASMGGAGVALVRSPAAMVLNTAGLSETGRLATSFTFTPFIVQLRYPWLNQQGQPETISSERSIGPLGFVGLAVRLHDRVVTGLGAFLTAGLGAQYESVGGLNGKDAQMGAIAGEVQLPIAFQISDKLAIGAAYRISFAYHQMLMPMPSEENATNLVDSEMSTYGFDFRGFGLGLLYKPTSAFRIGISYRSAVRVRTEGKQKIDGVSTHDNVEVDYELPHNIKAGVAHSFLASRLTIATDLSYWMYSQSHKAHGWRDAVSLNIGAEYWVHESVPLRVGTFVGRSATSDAAIGPFVPSNGPTTGVTIGSGLRIDGWTCDVGLAFVYASKDNTIADSQGGTFAGRHEFSQNAFVASLTVGYEI